MKRYLKLIRVHHYIKNFLIFAPIICGSQIFNIDKLINCLAGFVAFCAISSIVYIVNDIRDKEKDRKHPTKCNRPIAAGTISVKSAWRVVVVLLVVASIASYVISLWWPVALLLLYLVLNLAYSFGLKNFPIIDISILVSGFFIRVLYGSVISSIVISEWLYLTVIAAAFYLSLGKRRNELRSNKDGETRNVLRSYPIEFLDKNMNVWLTLTNVFYTLWSMDKATVSNYNKYLIFSVPIVYLISMKYSLVVEKDSDGDPVEVLVHDKVLLALCLIYGVVVFSVLYL